jgi:hypothetical protein
LNHQPPTRRRSLAEVRRAAGLSQRALALKALIRPLERVGQIEAGHVKAFPAYRSRLTAALGLADESAIDWSLTAATSK